MNRGALEVLWYGRSSLSVPLAPLSWIYRAIFGIRALAYRWGWLMSWRMPVVVIVVGNIVVGGTGKTPLVIWLAEFLRRQGLRPGIACRGYGGRARRWPQQVRSDSDPRSVGDEPVLIARRAGCPVIADPRRCRAVAALAEHYRCNVVVCDDGLQDLALERDLEIAVIDGERRFGNGRCLPAGPLREPVGRLTRVDLVVTSGHGRQGEFSMQRRPCPPLRAIADPGRELPLEHLAGRRVHAVAGIGHPDQFFRWLKKAGLRVLPHAFPDHHAYRLEDLRFADDLPVIMTEKDAVKCEGFNVSNAWYLPLEAELPKVFEFALLKSLSRIRRGQEAA